MADLKMPELNNVMVAGNLTKDPTFRETSNNTPVVNFHVAINRRYRDSSNLWLLCAELHLLQVAIQHRQPVIYLA